MLFEQRDSMGSDKMNCDLLVIGNDEDYEWSKKIAIEQDLFKRCQVLFSPVMGVQSPTELADKILHDRLPVRFQIQLHKLLWNDAQGK